MAGDLESNSSDNNNGVSSSSSSSSSTSSFGLDSQRSSHQSQWLQNTLSEIDKKTNSMLTLIQEDGDTFAQRAEMYYKRRPELVKMVEDLRRSYRSLAERYHQLKSEQPPIALRSISSLSNASTKQHLQHSCVLEAPEPPKETSNTLAQLEFHVALLEDHLKQHGELIRRNEEKREIIRELRLEQQRMSEEIRALKSCASRETVASRRRSNASHVSRLKGLFFGRLSVDK